MNPVAGSAMLSAPGAGYAGAGSGLSSTGDGVPVTRAVEMVNGYELDVSSDLGATIVKAITELILNMVAEVIRRSSGNLQMTMTQVTSRKIEGANILITQEMTARASMDRVSAVRVFASLFDAMTQVTNLNNEGAGILVTQEMAARARGNHNGTCCGKPNATSYRKITKTIHPITKTLMHPVTMPTVPLAASSLQRRVVESALQRRVAEPIEVGRGPGTVEVSFIEVKKNDQMLAGSQEQFNLVKPIRARIKKMAKGVEKPTDFK
ncbi:hypothetical protein NE237_011614 [Protea cynaroides]|uniref:Uncharacterized protein n=1 Tax=Protea cynaroides TaxID=273540 RepID=A0A9Q0GV96_9MAGN|nr:hypothetical protein NE237_011614 [Protea cynaroides]